MDLGTHKVSQRDSTSHKPEEQDQARHAEDQYPCSETTQAGERFRTFRKPWHRLNTYNQFLRAHQSVNRKNAARTRDAILLAFVSKPHAINAAPISPEPRYPAGRVIQGIPPDIRVAPPSSAAYNGLHAISARKGSFGERNRRRTI